MKVAILGAGGQLASDVQRAFNKAPRHNVIPLPHAQVDVTDSASVLDSLTKAGPDVVVNCGAFHRVDECEKRPEEAFRVNAIGALNVALACKKLDALCVYISTDFVFDGEKGEPYTEEDAPCPINVYGASKLAGEFLVRQSCSKWLIARTASLFGSVGARGKGGNFVEAILSKAKAGENLRVISDITMSPTFAYDAAHSLERLVAEGLTGLFHVTNTGACTWFQFAAKAVELAGLDAKLESIPSSSYRSEARRPRNSSLINTTVMKSAKKVLRPWEEALEAYLKEKGHLQG